MANRRGKVFFEQRLAGIIEQAEDEFLFSYNAAYLADATARPISFTLPLRSEVYRSKSMFPFFDGLIPEGWLLEIATKTWKLRPQDRMGLLLAVCSDCIGAVSVLPAEGNSNE